MKDMQVFTQTIAIGEINCTLSCRKRDVHKGLHRLFSGFQSAEPSDITLELDIVTKLPEDEVKSGLAAGTVIESDIDVSCIYRMIREVPASVLLRVSRGYLHKKTGYKIMNLILPRAYYTARRVRNESSSMIVHSCGIMRSAGVFLFCGPSETGKTTVARSCQAENGQVLNDEMTLIRAPCNTVAPPTVHGLPIVGGIPEKRNLSGPLVCIINLKQSGTTAYRKIDKTDAYLRLMRQIITPKDFFPEQDTVATILKKNSGFAERIINAVPCYEMEFTLDRERFWEEIERLEEELTTKHQHLPAFSQG